MAIATSSRRRRLAAAIAADDRPTYIIAAASHIIPNDVGAFVTGRKSPTPAQAHRLAEALSLQVPDLFDDGDLK